MNNIILLNYVLKKLKKGSGESEYNAKIKSIVETSNNNVASIVEKIDTIDLNNRNSASYFFSNMTSLLKVNSIINTTNLTNISGMFSACTNFAECPFFDTSNVTDMSRMFSSCNNLEEIPLFDTSKVTNISQMFQNVSKLSKTSLDNILQMCINATNYTGTKTLLQIGLNRYIYTQATIEALPHYQAFLDSGWTIGY